MFPRIGRFDECAKVVQFRWREEFVPLTRDIPRDVPVRSHPRDPVFQDRLRAALGTRILLLPLQSQPMIPQWLNHTVRVRSSSPRILSTLAQQAMLGRDQSTFEPPSNRTRDP